WYLRRTEGVISKKAKTFIENWVKLLAPFIPFTCEEAWSILGKEGFVSIESWPIVLGELISPEAELQEEVIIKLIEDVRRIINLIPGKKEKLTIYISSREKIDLIEEIYKIVEEEGQKNMGRIIKTILSKLPGKEKIASTLAKIYVDLISSLIPNYKLKTIINVAEREEEIYREAREFISKELGLGVEIYREGEQDIYDPLNKSEITVPLRPGIYIE
ncbi:MAG: class I tRNA ligase family protein, partial [Nitrososphaerota archaeon]